MDAPGLDGRQGPGDAWTAWLNAPLTSLQRFLGWLAASIVFFGATGLLGGPTEGDAAESVYSTWAIAHGYLACSYPPASTFHFPIIATPYVLTAPLYPLVSGALAALLRVGVHAPFPSRAQLGPNCSHAFVAMFHWSSRASTILTTIRLSYVVWFALVAGIVALLQTTRRRNSRWEPFTLVSLAGAPPVLMCLVDYFHPQDILALGLAIGALAFARRDRWIWAGVLVGLSIATQQFAWLVAAPLLVIAPRDRRLGLAGATLGAAALIDLPLVVATSGRALHQALFGSSRIGLMTTSTARPYGGTVLWETNLRGVSLFLLSRVLPVVGSLGLAWWARRRLGPEVLDPVPLVSLVATSLCLRLVFEENLFGYYFMATTVMLILLDVVGGRIRGRTVAWVALVSLAFNPVHWGLYSNWTPWAEQLYVALPIASMAIVALVIVSDVHRRVVRWYWVAWFALVAPTCVPEIWQHHSSQILPNWLWQVMLVPTALVLAAGPLLRTTKKVRAHPIEMVS